ncbi:MAG: VWA domain-containing protein [bacterium]
MRFANASVWVISLFWLIPIMGLFYIYAFTRKARLIELFCKRHLAGHIIPRRSRARQWFKALLILAGIACIILAVMRPRWGFHWEEVRRQGVDLMVVVDCSQSMMATDVKPNRLERAKREIRDLLGMLAGDRIGLIAFAGTSFVQCPLTLDYNAFGMFLDYIDTDLIPVQGTAIGHAIRESIASFDRTPKGSQAIILITDGEDHEGDPLAAAAEAKKRGIKIFPIGIGMEGGAPIPNTDGTGFKKDRQGNLILSTLDEGTLQGIALETGGRYVRSVTGDLDLEKIYLEGVRMMDQTELASTKKRVWEERFQWFLLLALIVLMIEQLLPEYRRERKRVSNGARIACLCAFLLLLPPWVSSLSAGILPLSKPKEAERFFADGHYDKALSAYLDAQIDSPDDPVLHYNIGATYYRMNKYEEAARNYEAAAARTTDIDLRERAYYNLGNCAYRMGKMEDAVAWYQKAIELDPNDGDAHYNMEFVRQEMQRRKEQAQERQEGKETGEDKGGDTKGAGEQERPGDSGKEKPEQGDRNKGTPEGKEKRKSGAEDQRTAQPHQDPNEAAGLQQGEARPPGEDTGEKGRPAFGMQIDPKEAERLLESIDEERGKPSDKQPIPGMGTHTPEKDW